MNQMTEELKHQIITDFLISRHNYVDRASAEDEATKIKQLVRALDSYRERDEKGRFAKAVSNEP